MTAVGRLALGAMGRLRPKPLTGECGLDDGASAGRHTGVSPTFETLARSRSARDFAPDPLPLPALSGLLWAAYGVNRSRPSIGHAIHGVQIAEHLKNMPVGNILAVSWYDVGYTAPAFYWCSVTRSCLLPERCSTHDSISTRPAIGWSMETVVSAAGVYLSLLLDLPTAQPSRARSARRHHGARTAVGTATGCGDPGAIKARLSARAGAHCAADRERRLPPWYSDGPTEEDDEQ